VSSGSPDDHDGDSGRRNVGNLVALIAIVVLFLLGYWLVTELDKQGKLQNCLLEGRRDCLEIVSPTR